MSRKRILSDNQVAAIADNFDNKGATALAREYNVSRQTIYRAVEEYAAGQGETAKTVKAKRAPLGEMGVTGLARFGGTVREDYNRTWQNLLTMVPLVKEMLDHPIVGATMFAVEMYIRTAEWSVVPGGTEDKDLVARDFLEECMNDMSHTFADHITQALSMLSYGFAPFEIVYKRRLGKDKDPSSEYDDGRIGWRKLAFRSQDTLAPGHEWEFDDNGGIRGMYQKADWERDEVFIPIEKMILYRTTAAKNNPQGRSALRSAYMAWYYAKNFAEIEGISAERMGGGLPVIYLGEGTTRAGSKSDFDFAKQVVRDVRSDEQAGVVFPYPKQTQDGRGVLFELVSPPAKGVVDFNRAITRYNQQISQTLLAQFIFLGLTEYGTQSLAMELTDLFSEAVNGWISVVADVLNRYIVPRLFAYNTFNVDHLPQFYAAPTQDMDVEKVMNAITLAVGAGVLLPDQGTDRMVRKLLELPQREDPDAGLLLSDVPEYREAKEQEIADAQAAATKPGEDTGKTEGTGKTKAAQLATSRVRRHKPVRNPADKAKQVSGSKKFEDEPEYDEYVDRLELVQTMVADLMESLQKQEPMQIHVHNVIDQPKETEAPQVSLHVDARQAEQEAPQVNLHVDASQVPQDPAQVDVHVAPQIDVHVPEQEAAKVDVHVDGAQVHIPETPVKVDLELEIQSPDEVVETETFVERDAAENITKTKRWSWRRGKTNKNDE
ncbi:MAG: phage portal protein family protein [Candidatus Thorarchaeota archaeon]|jgi:hypothetical protein